MTHLEKDFVACIASVSERVRRESWDESKKKKGMRGERGRERYNSTGNACYAG